MPYHRFETERLLLRAMLTEDADFLLELLNSPKWIQYIGDRNVKTLEEAAEYIRSRMYPQLERLGFSNYMVIRKSDGKKMGSCGLYDREGLEGIDIGFAFLPEYEGFGYAFEAASTLKNAAFELFGLKSISAITTKDNFSSQKLLEKLGLVLMGTAIIEGDEEELLLYGLEG
jgi:RimJ/RimL family protein N-acetyltransferase